MTAGDVVRVAYVGGVGRSGTTVLDRMLGGVSGLVSAGEVVHLWHRGVLADEKCGCGRAFSSCEFWQAVGQQAYGGWTAGLARRVLELKSRCDRTRFIPLLARPGASSRVDTAVDELRSVLLPLYTAVRDVAGARVVVDSSKHASYAYLLRRLAGMDVGIVHTVRAVEGVAFSWQKQVARPEREDGQEMPRYSAGRVSVRWVAQNVLFERLRAQGDGTMVRYEDLVARPVEELGRILESLELGDPAQLDHVRQGWTDLRPAHTVAGNPMRFRTGRLELRQDDAWRSGLSAVDTVVARAVSAPVGRRFGYPVLTRDRGRTR